MDNEQSDARAAASDLAERRASFSRFGQEDWAKWINSFLNEEFCEPSVTIGPHEPFVILGNVYHELEFKSQRDLFAEAVKILFESTPVIKQNTRYLRSLLELLALLKPYKAKSLLRRHLFSRSFAGMEDGGMNLHTLLLIVNSKYEVDEELLDFIERTAKEAKDFGYRLTCLRIGSQLGGAEYLKILDIVLEHANEPRSAILLARELGDIMFLHGSRRFAEWYTAKLRAMTKKSDALNAFELLEEGLRKVVFRDINLFAPDQDSYSTLIAAQLYAHDRFYTAKELVAIGRLQADVGVDATVEALINIWNRIKAKVGSRTQPWYLTRYSSSHPYQLASGRSAEPPDSERIWENEEPDLIQVFEATKDAGCNVPLMIGVQTAAASWSH
jgi:hypothetical protein